MKRWKDFEGIFGFHVREGLGEEAIRNEGITSCFNLRLHPVPSHGPIAEGHAYLVWRQCAPWIARLKRFRSP